MTIQDFIPKMAKLRRQLIDVGGDNELIDNTSDVKVCWAAQAYCDLDPVEAETLAKFAMTRPGLRTG